MCFCDGDRRSRGDLFVVEVSILHLDGLRMHPSGVPICLKWSRKNCKSSYGMLTFVSST